MDDPGRIYTHRSAGRDQGAAETVARVIFGEAWPEDAPPEPEA